eukprot:COSAG06_NODE_33847_length_483_cov_1.273438_1_plen_80_part_01
MFTTPTTTKHRVLARVVATLGIAAAAAPATRSSRLSASASAGGRASDDYCGCDDFCDDKCAMGGPGAPENRTVYRVTPYN